MNDTPTTGLRRANARPKAPLVDTVAPRASRVPAVGTGVSAAAELEGGEGLAGYMATSCPNYCGYDNGSGKVVWCSPSCREFGAWGRDI